MSRRTQELHRTSRQPSVVQSVQSTPVAAEAVTVEDVIEAAPEAESERATADRAKRLADDAMREFGVVRPCRVVRRDAGLDLQFGGPLHVPKALIGAVRRAVSEGTGGAVSVEGRALVQ
jgi:hypothetical protein